MLETPEVFSRIIFDLQDVGPHRFLTIERDVPSEIRLEEFLTWQLARRIQQALIDELEPSGAVQVGRCHGTYQEGEFAFTLNVVPSTEGALDEATMRQTFRTSTGVIAKVLSGYQFKSFDTVRLIHPESGRYLVLPKARFEVFR